MRSYLCLQNISLGQFENQNVSRPNQSFLSLSILKNFSLGAGWNAKIQCFSLTHVIANRLNLRYISRAVMVEWSKHLTKDVGVPVRVSPDPSYELSTPGC